MIPKNLRQTRAAKAQKSRSKVVSLPAPVGGWNARDSLAEMKPDDAVDLINWFPRASLVELRKGHALYNGFGATSLMAYTGGTSNYLLGANAGFLYNYTLGTQYSVFATLSSSVLQYVNFATSGGNYLTVVNGVDIPQAFDGTSFANMAITGATSNNFSQVNAFKNRLWFVEKDTLKAWYLPTASIGGAANVLDLSALATRGGSLVAMGTWTIDAGYGMDDLAVFITNQGEVLVYRGTDPSSASTWALVGIYLIGRPIGTRPFLKYQGDLLLITQDGLVPLSAALQSSRTNPRIALTDKIQQAVSRAVAEYGSNYGWQVIDFPAQSMLLLNVPVAYGTQEQYVMNTITKQWARFKGMDATCWEVLNDKLYFGQGDTSASGGTGGVYEAWTGFADNGTAIDSVALQSFNYFGSSGQQKRWMMMRPMLYANSNANIAVAMNVEFSRDLTATANTRISMDASIPIWNTATWDSAVWGDEYGLSRAWTGATGVGNCAAVKLGTASSTLALQWISTDVVLEPGAIL